MGSVRSHRALVCAASASRNQLRGKPAAARCQDRAAAVIASMVLCGTLAVFPAQPTWCGAQLARRTGALASGRGCLSCPKCPPAITAAARIVHTAGACRAADEMVSVPRTTLEQLLLRDFARSLHEMDAGALANALDALGGKSQPPRAFDSAPAPPVGPAEPADVPPPAARPRPQANKPPPAPDVETPAARSEGSGARPDAAARSREEQPRRSRSPRSDDAQEGALGRPRVCERLRHELCSACDLEGRHSYLICLCRAHMRLSWLGRALYLQGRRADSAEKFSPPPGVSDDRKASAAAKARQAAFADAVAKTNDRSRAPEPDAPGGAPAFKPLDQTAELLGLQLPSMGGAAERPQGAAQPREPPGAPVQDRVASAARSVAALPLALWQALDAAFPASMQPSAGVPPRHTCFNARRSKPFGCISNAVLTA